MVTFVGTLMIGAVIGFMLEKQVGALLLRWSRIQRMRMRVLRRQGENPWNVWKGDD
jgi:hypothetical protein